MIIKTYLRSAKRFDELLHSFTCRWHQLSVYVWRMRTTSLPLIPLSEQTLLRRFYFVFFIPKVKKITDAENSSL